MYRITLLSDASGEQSDIAALSVLSHRVDLYPLATSAKRFETAHHDVVMIDARPAARIPITRAGQTH